MSNIIEKVNAFTDSPKDRDPTGVILAEDQEYSAR